MTFTLWGAAAPSEPGGPGSLHDPWMVLASFAVVALASFAAVEMAERLLDRGRPNASLWRAGSAATLAVGIWSMHYVGMLGVTKPVPAAFVTESIVLSFAVVSGSAVVSFLFIGPGREKWFHFAAAGTLMGFGIAAMHMIGVHGAFATENPGLHAGELGPEAAGGASVAIAVATLFVSNKYRRRWIRRLVSLFIAISAWSMHYTAMAATLIPSSGSMPEMDGPARMLRAAAIIVAVMLLLALALVSAAADRRILAASAHEMEALRQANAALLRTQEEFLRRLSSVVEHRDNDTGAHVARMSAMSRELALAAGYPAEQANQIALAALLHDIGKVGISDAILLKPGKLSADQRLEMQRHAALGYWMLAGSGLPLLDLAAEIAHSHHEAWDGSGYPRGLKGEEIPLGGRIVAVVDVIDALLSTRPYKQPWPLSKVLEHVSAGAGAQFDPRLVSVLLANIPSVLSVWLPKSPDIVAARAVVRPWISPGIQVAAAG